MRHAGLNRWGTVFHTIYQE